MDSDDSPHTDSPATMPPGTPDAAVDGGDPDDDSVTATPDDNRRAVVRRTRRGYTPVRHAFVQKHSGPNRASTLARFCANRKKRALVLYLLLLTLWTPDGRPMRSEIWLRTLNVAGGEMTWSKSSLSMSWSALVDMGMATRKRTRRMADLVPKREDGEDTYTLPDGKKIIDRYFALPGAFWTEKWFDELSLPGICVLLVLLKETNDDTAEVHLTHKQFDDWYGISVSSAKKGLAELEAHGLLSVRRHRVKAEFALEGFTLHLYYRLNGEFSTAARKAARTAASKAAEKTAKKSTKTMAKMGGAPTTRKTARKAASGTIGAPARRVVRKTAGGRAGAGAPKKSVRKRGS